jgi:hypothetical protein
MESEEQAVLSYLLWKPSAELKYLRMLNHNGRLLHAQSAFATGEKENDIKTGIN